MKRYLMTIEYVGTNYEGFQLQKGKTLKTVQGQVENAMEQVFLQKVKVFASGRLDAGVHAKELKAHFDLKTNIMPERMITGINHFLPNDIAVQEISEVNNNFHARYDVKQKTYEYKLYIGKYKHPLLEDRQMYLYEMPDIEKMQKAGKLFLGTHDFKAFMNKSSKVKTTIRTINSLNIKEEYNEITITVCGNGFLYNMVRIMVGTLLEVGYNNMKLDEITSMLTTGIRKRAYKIVEAKGLTLLKVEY